jgi:acetyl esterase/lipase
MQSAGGGYTIGHPDMDDDLCRLTCVTHNISVVSVDYRLAPEHPFPIGFEDSYAALKWVTKPILSLNDLCFTY